MPINRLFRIFKLEQEWLVLLICKLMKSINTCLYNCLRWLFFKISCFCFTFYSWLSAAYLTSKNNFSWVAFMRVNFFLTESNILWSRKDAFDDVLGNFFLTVLCRTAMVHHSENHILTHFLPQWSWFITRLNLPLKTAQFQADGQPLYLSLVFSS